jgi:hypothetical protein
VDLAKLGQMLPREREAACALNPQRIGFKEGEVLAESAKAEPGLLPLQRTSLLAQRFDQARAPNGQTVERLYFAQFVGGRIVGMDGGNTVTKSRSATAAPHRP